MYLSKWLIIIFFFPLIIIPLVYGIINPKNSFLLGRRWQFKNEVEPTEFVLDMHKLFCIAMLIVVIIILFLLIIS
ncbi:hypothetical protein SAMN02745176_03117 [Lutispora thermophila DSM 19022]|uniref:DUF6199 domain-containing protein n=1 Tax=Lutispora thermophila DSM 19022 TaxID=1122184 RepID=A0A1M6I7T2_9FIRM|nr:hypothetical protein SAMN02745176_03117 [Lutispora thermophila DSM 19022]